MANKRIFYACHQGGLAPDGSETFTEIHGLQSIGMTTTYNLEQAFEIGQISIYENIENIPDIEVTLEKVLDGYPLIYHLATPNATLGTLVGRSNDKATFAMTLFDDTFSAASGDALSEVQCSGMFTSNMTYTFPVDGFFTESVTMVGQDKVWDQSNPVDFAGAFDNTDTPLAVSSGLGGIQRRENLLFNYSDATTTDTNGSVVTTQGTVLPQDIPGISSSGTNDKLAALNEFSCSVQSITVSTDLGREDLFELGRKAAYHKFATFPVEVTCDIEIIAKNGDLIDAGENTTLTARTIRIGAEDSTFLNLGTENKLSSITWGGGDATGGNDTITFSYSNFNDMSVYHDQDPAGIAAS